MGGENSKDLPDEEETLDNTYISQASGMNKTMISAPGDDKANSSSAGGKAGKGTTYLGLKTNTTQFVDTSINQYEDKALEILLVNFYDQLITDKEKKYSKKVAENFNETCSEGYQLLVNVLLATGRDPDKISKMRVTTLMIMYELFVATSDATTKFFELKEAQQYLIKFFKSIVNNYKGNGDQFGKLIDCLRVFADKQPIEIVELLFKKCKFIQNVSPMMLDSDGAQDNTGKNDKTDILRKLFQFLEFCTDDTQPIKMSKTILELIYKQPGLIANMIFNLNNPKEDDPDILSAQISIIGSMCFHLKKFQKSKFMVESGTYNLVFIMTKMDDLKFQLKSLIAIRKATSCRTIELLDTFVADGLIETLVGILNVFGLTLLRRIEEKKDNERTENEKIIRQIQVNCICIIIQLCYRAQNIKKITELGALELIKSMEHMKFQNQYNKAVYTNTVLQYCSENQSIRLQGPPRFFAKQIFEKMAELQAQDIEPNDRQYKLCMSSFANLSLVITVHDVIWQEGYLKTIYQVIAEFRRNILDKDLEKIKRSYLRYVYAVRTITNCLTTDHAIFTFQKPGFKEICQKYIEFFQFFNDWNNEKFNIFPTYSECLAFQDQIDKDTELSSFFQTIQDESTLALFLIFTDPTAVLHEANANKPLNEQQSYKQIKYLMQILKNHSPDCYDVHLLVKALVILRKFHANTWRQSKLLYYSGILIEVKNIMAYAEAATTREAAHLCVTIMQNPDDMICWLKFSNQCLTLNSACTDDYFVQWGEPHRLPNDRGLYRNWGAFFDFGDVIEVPGGFQLTEGIMERWSVSFWLILPLTLYDTKRKHVLIQSIHGMGAYVEIDELGEQLQCICEDTGKAVTAKIDLRKQRKGWHNIIVVCDNLDPECEGSIRFFFNGKHQNDGQPQRCICVQPISFIGNSKNGSQPFGTVCDLRIFPYCLKKNQIETLSNYHEDIEFDMPDKYCSSFVEIGMIKLILDDIGKYARSDTKINLIRVLTYICTHRDCKAYVLKYNGLEKAMELALDVNDDVKFFALSFLQGLQ